MMVDDEPLIRKAVSMEMNERGSNATIGSERTSFAEVECHTGDFTTEQRRVEMVETFASGPSLMAALENAEIPDYVLVDMEFQGEPTGGLLITRRLHERYPQVKIIIFSGRFDNPSLISENRAQRVNEIGSVVMEALRLGASAFVSKNAAGGFSIENILRAIACLERGDQWFNLVRPQAAIEVTEAERQLLLLEAAGCTASEISNQLGESDKAIQEHQKDLSQRFDIVNKSAARVAKALSLGLISPGDIKFLPRN